MNAGLLRTGDGILCRALTRQRRQGQPSYIKGATVAADGSVEFRGQKFYKPSKLAVEMVNSAATDPKQRVRTAWQRRAGGSLPELGRFLTPDPSFLLQQTRPVLQAPRSLHLYTYMLNDPLNRVDPYGLFFGPDCLAAGA